MRKIRLALLLVVIAVLVGVVANSILGRKLFFTRDVHDQASFFRLRVHLRHAGEPVEADIVVGCGARVTRYRDGGSSLDVGRFPYRYAFSISAGHALEIRTPGLCNGGTTANGDVPKDFLPYVIWYEHADDLSFGILYASDDAYANPRAQLTFSGAEVEPATPADFERWMASAPENLIPRWAAGSLTGDNPDGLKATPDLLADPARYARLFGSPSNCYGVLRLQIPETLRPALARFRPADELLYWVPAADDWRAVSDVLYASKPAANRVFEGQLLSHYRKQETPGNGLYRRSGGGTIPYSIRDVQGSLFLLRWEAGLPWLRPGLERSATTYVDLEVAPETQGFAYCFDADWQLEHRDRRPTMRINGIEASGRLLGFDYAFSVFEKDEYLYLHRRF
ncbi:hypothetical protein [Methylobacterium thuringiense]|nr:hypothetical protein [Methylobacterium thuringiense]